MNQLTMGLLVALGLVTFFLYNQNQTLTQNNIKLEAAVEQQEEAMAAMKEQYEKQGKALQNMSRKNAEIEAEKLKTTETYAMSTTGGLIEVSATKELEANSKLGGVINVHEKTDKIVESISLGGVVNYIYNE